MIAFVSTGFAGRAGSLRLLPQTLPELQKRGEATFLTRKRAACESKRPFSDGDWMVVQSMVLSSLSFLIIATASANGMVPRLSPLRPLMVTVLASASRSPSTNM